MAGFGFPSHTHSNAPAFLNRDLIFWNILGYDVSIECNAGALADFDHRARREVFPRTLHHDDNATAVH